MIRLDRIVRDYREAGALNELIALWGFVDDSTFMTKAGDVGVVFSMSGPDATGLTHEQRQRMTHQVESALRLLNERVRVYQYFIKEQAKPFAPAKSGRAVAAEAFERRTSYLNGRRSQLFTVTQYLVLLLEHDRLSAVHRSFRQLCASPIEAIREALKENKVEEILDFLDRLKLNRYVPVFIFTNADVETVKATLGKRAGLYQVGQPSHLFVKSKDEVIGTGVMKVLNDWAATVPSALALRRWELEYEKAKNALFADFYASSIYWPVVLWQTFEADGVPGSDELGRLISRNLLSRMTPFDMDMKEFVKQLEELKDQDPVRYRSDLLKVLEGERLVRSERLHDDRVATGDVFKMSGNYYINIRPDCDCIPREGVNDPELYLLKGSSLGPSAMSKQLERDRGLVTERDDEAIVFALHEEKTVSFKLREIRISKWSEVKDKRVGRLLPPFATRVQQRYAAYLQRPGIPKIPTAAMPEPPASPGPSAAVASPSSTPPMPQQIGPGPSGQDAVQVHTINFGAHQPCCCCGTAATTSGRPAI